MCVCVPICISCPELLCNTCTARCYNWLNNETMSMKSDSSTSSALTALATAASKARRELTNNDGQCNSGASRSPVVHSRPSLTSRAGAAMSGSNSSCSTISSDKTDDRAEDDFTGSASAKRNEPWPIDNGDTNSIGSLLMEIDATTASARSHRRGQSSAITATSSNPTSSGRKKRKFERHEKSSGKRGRSNANANADSNRSRTRKKSKRPAKSSQRKVADGGNEDYSEYLISRIPKPKRPMTAYNFFFQAERKKILDMGLEDYNAMMDPSTSTGSPSNGNVAIPNSDPNAGMKAQVSFQEMGKTIGRHWKNVPKEDLERYQALAKEESARYEREMKIYAAEVAAVKEKAALRESNREDSVARDCSSTSAKTITDSDAGSVSLKSIKESDPFRGIINSLSKDQINQLLKLRPNTVGADSNMQQCRASSAQPLDLDSQSILAPVIERLQTVSGVVLSAQPPPTLASPHELSLISSQAHQIAQLQAQVQMLMMQQQQPPPPPLMQNQAIPQVQQVLPTTSTWSQPTQVSTNHLTTNPSMTLATFANLPSTNMKDGVALAAGTFLPFINQGKCWSEW